MPESTVVSPTLQNIPIDKIKPAAHQARKTFDEESIKALAESIRQEGQLQPILVRPVAEGYELISGERRLRAVKWLAQPTIEAKVIQPMSEAETAAKGLVENLQRENLNPMEEAEGIQALLDLKDGHWTQEQIGKVVGKSQSHISETIRLLKLPEQVQQNIRIRIISPDNGAELVRLPGAELQLKVAGEVVQKGLNSKATRALVNKMLKGDQKEGKTSGKPADPVMGFHFAWKGENLTVHGCWSPAGRGVATQSQEFQNALDEFLSKQPKPKKKAKAVPA